MSEMKWTPGPLVWNGNEITCLDNPSVGVAGIAHDADDRLGPMLAAAPELYEALDELNEVERGDLVGAAFKRARNNAIIKADRALAKARGQS